MNKTSWAWAADGLMVSVKAGAAPPQAYGVCVERLREVNDFATAFDIASEVFEGLKAARLSFLRGRADYTEAALNLRRLIQQLDAAAEFMLHVAEDVCSTLEPMAPTSPEVRSLFGGDGELFSAFAKDVIAVMGKAAMAHELAARNGPAPVHAHEQEVTAP